MFPGEAFASFLFQEEGTAGLERQRGDARGGAGFERLRPEARDVEAEIMLFFRHLYRHSAAAIRNCQGVTEQKGNRWRRESTQ